MLREFFDWVLESSLSGIVSIAHYPLLITATACLILYGGGYKKAGKYVPASIILYVLLKCVKVAVLK